MIPVTIATTGIEMNVYRKKTFLYTWDRTCIEKQCFLYIGGVREIQIKLSTPYRELLIKNTGRLLHKS